MEYFLLIMVFLSPILLFCLIISIILNINFYKKLKIKEKIEKLKK